MKIFTTLSIALVMSASGLALAQSGDMKNMDMHKDMPMDMHKNMQMDKHADKKEQGGAKKEGSHQATATVKSVDSSKGTVTLAHEPIKSLKWPAMTMGFTVKDKALFDKLKEGEKVNVEFMKQGSEYVITSVK